MQRLHLFVQSSFFTLAFLFAFHSVVLSQSLDSAALDRTFGRKGTVQGGMYKVTFPRSDLKVKIGKVAIEPALALTSWIAFKPMGNEAMIMGDMVLLEKEITPVLSKLYSSGLEISAIHNHLTGESPNVKYVHFAGRGSAADLASKIKAVLAVTGTPMTAPKTMAQSSAIDWSSVESILDVHGQKKGSVLQVNVPRADTIRDHDMVIPPFMGMAEAINLQMVGKKAAATGDFVLVANEVNPVAKALIENGIAVSALHNHMLIEAPRIFFMHFWAYDSPEKVARGLKAALDLVHTKK